MVCLEQFIYEKNRIFSTIIESDNKVAYAYLLEGETIIADVWLFNIEPTPQENEWEREDLPFTNPAAYSKAQTDYLAIRDMESISIQWIENELIEAEIFVKNRLLAILQSGLLPKPGRCVNAAKDGPLAKCLEN